GSEPLAASVAPAGTPPSDRSLSARDSRPAISVRVAASATYPPGSATDIPGDAENARRHCIFPPQPPHAKGTTTVFDRSLFLPGFAALAALLIVSSVAIVSAQDSAKKPTSVLEFHVKDIDGKGVDLAKFKGKVLLIVNTASQCGYTPQYKDLQAIY